jgi:hypothetical protein
MNKEEAIDALVSNTTAFWNAVVINGWQQEMLNEQIKRIVDQIEPDHPKVKMPSEVGEDLEDWLAVDDIDDVLDDLACVYDGDHQAVRDWWDSTLGATYLIADMARYGWEPEPEERFYVLGPKSWGYEHAWASIRNGHMSWDSYKEHGKDLGFQYAQAFTRAELKKYHLDNDIFTLVPVEDSHGEA